MKVFFSGDGENVNMHLMGITVKEAVALNEIYNHKKSNFEQRGESFKEKLNEFKAKENESIESEEKKINNEHNLESYLSWRGSVKKVINDV